MGAPKAEHPLEVAVTGQLLLSHPLLESRHGPFLDLVERIRNADVAVTGFEGVFAGRGAPSPKASLHIAPQSVAETLAWMGFSLVALAGNHAFDLGPDGIVHTIEVLRAHGLVTSGTGEDPETAHRATFVRPAGGGRVALLSRQLGPNAAGEQAVPAISRDDLPEAQAPRPGVAHIGVDRTVTAKREIFAALAELLGDTGHTARRRERVAMGADPDFGSALDAWGTPVRVGAANTEYWHIDPVSLEDLHARVRRISDGSGDAVVHLHNHYWASDPTDVPLWFEELATSVGAAGAPVVIGHGYPGIQAFRLRQGQLAAYGMGSLTFHTRRPQRYTGLQYWESVVILARLTTSGLCEKVELLPVVHGHHPDRTRKVSDLGEPELADFEVGKAILERLDARCAPLSTRVTVRRADGRAVGEVVDSTP